MWNEKIRAGEASRQLNLHMESMIHLYFMVQGFKLRAGTLPQSYKER